ncbi:CoA pyrophosphatase [Clostridium tetani]|uniref:NUDIX hydrolase n=1 Tax=Clostridium tetani TaxID=1513 RepID=UPI0029551052|nr:CoA pyrophosphatase [Clostridium tetani]BDR66595.1 coenzyme A pyrophosphatase [Clostridium tetani]
MINDIKKIFENRENGILGNHERSAVVLFLCEDSKGELYIIFEVRALHLDHQPGDISLPGGKIEKNESPQQAATRESLEELNVDLENISIIGAADCYVTPYNKIIYPFVGLIKDIDIKPNKDEVNHVFKVPLKFFMENEPKCYEVNIVSEFPEDFPYHLIIGGKDYNFSKGNLKQYFYQYNGYVIWGFTALIVKSFIEELKSKINNEN